VGTGQLEKRGTLKMKKGKKQAAPRKQKKTGEVDKRNKPSILTKDQKKEKKARSGGGG